MAITLGPLVLSLPRLLLLLGVVAGLVTAHILRKRDGVEREGFLWLTMLAGFVVARLAYVGMHFGHFASHPLKTLYIWQGGFEPFSGAAATLLTAFLLARRRKLAPGKLLAPVVAGLLVWGVTSWITFALQTAHERTLPDMAVQTLAGEPVLLSKYQGTPLVVNIWATWCPPCRREMPVLAEAANKNPGVTFLFINQGEAREDVARWLASQDLELEHVLLDVFSRSGTELGARGLPTTLFFGAEGRLVDTHVGEISAPRLGDKLRRLRDAPAAK